MNENQLKGTESLLLVRKQLASCYSVAANVMECFELTRVVQIYLPACSQEQYEALMKDIGDDVICIYPLKRGSRMMIFCEYMTDFNDEQCMFMYQTVLDMLFAKEDGRMTMPYHVRVYEYTNYAEGL